MAWDNNFIDELKMQINIVDVIGRNVELKRAGSNYKGLCPFHSEKTPSFMVSEEKQIFNCFGCGKKGDAIKFVEEFQKIPFIEAVELLCNEYGIKMPENTHSNSKIDYEKYYKINALAGKFFYNSLSVHGNRGLSYFYNRRITKDTITKWGLGYAPSTGDALVKHLKEQGVADDDMVKLGLAAIGKSGELYDKFRDRVMFPIINTQGKVIGFGGRAIENIKPKYLNSNESEIFLKKNNLFGLNITKKDISDEDRAIMVEGYMDVISLWQSGVKNVAASLGTALTDNQAKLITRYTKNIVLAYDSDNAGIAASLRGIDVMSVVGAKTRVLSVTDGKDPDEYVKIYGKEGFNKLVNAAIPSTEFKLNFAKTGLNFNDDMDVLDYIEKVVPILRKLPPVEQDIYINRLSKEYSISDNAIKMAIQANSKEKSHISKIQSRRRAHQDSYDDLDVKIELSLLVLAIKNPSYLDRIKQDSIEFRTPLAKKILSAIDLIVQKCELDSNGIDEKIIYQALDPEEEIILAKYIDSIKFGPAEEVFYIETSNSYLLNRAKQERIELLNDLSIAEKLGQSDEINNIASKILKLDSIIKELTEEKNA